MQQRIEEHLAALRNGGPARQWLTVEEAAEELQASRDTVERLIASGNLQAAELTTSTRTTTHWTYDYDNIANRETYTLEIEPNEPSPTNYVTNELNQYRRLQGPYPGLAPGLWCDQDGNLGREYDLIPADMNCDGIVNFDDVDAFALALQGREAYEAVYPWCNWLNGDLDGDQDVDFDDLELFNQHLGEMGIRRAYTWDGENRLIQVAPQPDEEEEGDLKVEFAYDHMGRRVEKKVSTWDEVSQEWDLTQHRKFVWGGTGGSSASGGWLMLLELEGGTGVPPVDTVVRKYTWGLDLAGQNGGAASGSAGALTDASGALAGRFMMLRLVESRGTFEASFGWSSSWTC